MYFCASFTYFTSLLRVLNVAHTIIIIGTDCCNKYLTILVQVIGSNFKKLFWRLYFNVHYNLSYQSLFISF